MHFIQQDESPFSGSEEIHHLLRIMRPFLSIRDHRVGGYNDAGVSCELQKTKGQLYCTDILRSKGEEASDSLSPSGPP